MVSFFCCPDGQKRREYDIYCKEEKRGTGSASTYKGNAVGSLTEYSFHWTGKSDRLYLFEAPIDMLSFISMNKDGWRNHSYAAACSVSDKVLFQCLADNPGINRVSICFDSDEPGQDAPAQKQRKRTSKKKGPANRQP